ncbi:protein of unknown function [Methylacidimicrobium sp. AP8]|nr:protein of unknown function [Methylacidimicrobium sp. AP8]
MLPGDCHFSTDRPPAVGPRRRTVAVRPNPRCAPRLGGLHPRPRAAREPAPLFGLAPRGVCRASAVAGAERWALTPPFHPCRIFRRGGLFSVTLSVPGGLRRPSPRLPAARFPGDVRTFLSTRRRSDSLFRRRI